MWTVGGSYDRGGLRYPSDVTDDVARALIPPAKRGGRKRNVDVRDVVNGLMYILSTSIANLFAIPPVLHITRVVRLSAAYMARCTIRRATMQAYRRRLPSEGKGCPNQLIDRPKPSHRHPTLSEVGVAPLGLVAIVAAFKSVDQLPYLL